MFVSQLGLLVQGRAARVGHTQNSCYLIEALSRGIVQGGPQDLHIRVALHVYDHGVAAGDHQAQKGGLQVRIGQIVGGNVPPDVVDGDQRLAQGVGRRLGEVDPHQHGTDEPRSIGNGYSVQVGPGQACVGKGLICQAIDGLNVLPGGDFRHNAAIEPVQVHLGGNAVR